VVTSTSLGVVGLLIEYRLYSSSGLTVLARATCRLSRRRANQPADAIERL